jgi:DMSO/TMAO reductase YedYZ molybdopterin-dependent catalytic subunit
VRLVSPAQYGFVSTKHLCRIELYAAEPPAVYHHAQRVQLTLRMGRPHARARVWREERHRYLPAWAVRSMYRLVMRWLLGVP